MVKQFPRVKATFSVSLSNACKHHQNKEQKTKETHQHLARSTKVYITQLKKRSATQRRQTITIHGRAPLLATVTNEPILLVMNILIIIFDASHRDLSPIRPLTFPL
jgi:hypothetical protein